MWVKQCHKPPKIGHGQHTTCKNGEGHMNQDESPIFEWVWEGTLEMIKELYRNYLGTALHSDHLYKVITSFSIQNTGTSGSLGFFLATQGGQLLASLGFRRQEPGWLVHGCHQWQGGECRRAQLEVWAPGTEMVARPSGEGLDLWRLPEVSPWLDGFC